MRSVPLMAIYYQYAFIVIHEISYLDVVEDRNKVQCQLFK